MDVSASDRVYKPEECKVYKLSYAHCSKSAATVLQMSNAFTAQRTQQVWLHLKQSNTSNEQYFEFYIKLQITPEPS